MSNDDSGSRNPNASSRDDKIPLAVAAEDALREILIECDIELREFIVLTFVTDRSPTSGKRLAIRLGMSLDITALCIRRLVDVGFLEYTSNGDAPDYEVVATDLGKSLVRRVLVQL